jgi:hypothetical protein
VLTHTSPPALAEEIWASVGAPAGAGVAVARWGAAGEAGSGAFSDAGTAAPVAVAGCEVRALPGAVAAGSAGADAVAVALGDFVLLRDGLLGAVSVVEARAEVSAEAGLSVDFLDFLVDAASGAVAAEESGAAVSDFALFLDLLAEPESADEAPVADAAVSSVAFFRLDDLVEEAVPDEAPVSAALAALLLFLDGFDLAVSGDAVELSEEVASDFLDFFDFLGGVVDD